ncbi:MAG: rSAM/selenodomain-associated transferase 2 [Gammaproteobacteria bacterium]
MVLLADSPDPSISIIIPVLNEASVLVGCINQINLSSDDLTDIEIIICDGGSTDGTADLAQRLTGRFCSSLPGRSIQMNTGANIARGSTLLFLHVDTKLPKDWKQSILSAGNWGFFRVKLNSGKWPFRMIESFMNWRSSKTSVATGDQTLFFKSWFFSQVGEFPNISLMEDVAISKLARQCCPPTVVSDKVTTSSRRWLQNGILKTIITMWSLRLAYWMGCNPDRLHKIYYGARQQKPERP